MRTTASVYLTLPIVLALATTACGEDNASNTSTSTSSGSGAAAGSGGSASGGAGGGGGIDCVVDSSYDPVIDPTEFSTTIDNPLFPLPVGTTYTYTEGTDSVVVVVTAQTKVVQGVTCVEVHDTVSSAGNVVEDTYDWYAQKADGSVWYFGEDTKEYAGGQVISTAGSWEAGVDGAKAGMIIPPNPMVGQSFRQEYYACEAEDMAEVLALDASVTVPYGSFSGCMHTHEFTPLDPEVNEEKYYCPGVGIALAVDVAGGGEREELITVTP